MGFRANAFACVWSVEKANENMTKVRLSTSKKNKTTDKYEQDFSGFCTFVGTAKAKAERLKPKDKIKLLGVDVTTRYDKEKSIEYVNYLVFDFELQQQQNSYIYEPEQKIDQADESNDDDDDEDVPF